MIGPFRNEYAFLSNFHESSIWMKTHNGYSKVPTVEHGFVAAKAGGLSRLFAKTGLGLEEYWSFSPGEAKRLGRRIHIRSDWHKVRVRVMYLLVKQKFLDPELSALLIGTGDHELREANWWHDQFWGDCTCRRHNALVGDLVVGSKVGKNWLGRILMEVRDELKAETVDKLMWPSRARQAASQHAMAFPGHEPFVAVDNRWSKPYAVDGEWTFGLPKYKVCCEQCLNVRPAKEYARRVP